MAATTRTSTTVGFCAPTGSISPFSKTRSTFAWVRADKSIDGELDVVFTPAGKEQWVVVFDFDWEDEPRVFEGTAKGSLTGDLIGNVASDDPGHPLKFEFKGTFSEGTFTGTHGYFNREGGLVDSGTLEFAVHPAADPN